MGGGFIDTQRAHPHLWCRAPAATAHGSNDMFFDHATEMPSRAAIVS